MAPTFVRLDSLNLPKIYLTLLLAFYYCLLFYDSSPGLYYLYLIISKKEKTILFTAI